MASAGARTKPGGLGRRLKREVEAVRSAIPSAPVNSLRVSRSRPAHLRFSSSSPSCTESPSETPSALLRWPPRRRLLPALHPQSLAPASEVSSILESRIAGSAVGANVDETGRVLSKPPASLPPRTRMDDFSQVSVTVSHVSGVSRTSRVCTRTPTLNARRR
ncbi:hypothetical protein EIP86_008699 [Pleurotus ostreatoroseus]|nr:hypothetical protein EIP86_008699 [Pleurotus ostreatoroseus]